MAILHVIFVYNMLAACVYGQRGFGRQRRNNVWRRHVCMWYVLLCMWYVACNG